MAEYTPNLALKKPSNSDYVRISDNNENMDVLDADIKALQDAIEELEPVEIINDLNHTDADKALSANQGKVLDDKISTLTGRIANGEKTAAYEAKRLDNLIKLSQGKVFDYQTDETEAYSKAVPLGSQQYGSLDMVGGKSLVYNQLLKNEKASKTVSGVTITNNGDGSFTLNGTATASTRYELQESGFATILTHKYYISSHNSKMSSTWGYMIFTHKGSLRNAEYERVNAGTIVDVADALAFRVMNGTTYNNDIIKPICVDLTQMFGEGNEPTLEQCREIFSADYYPHNEGEIMNFGVNEVESVGANLIINQIRSQTAYGITIANEGEYFTINGTANDATNFNISPSFSLKSGHVYILRTGVTSAVATDTNAFVQILTNPLVVNPHQTTNSDPYAIRFTVPTDNDTWYARVRINKNTTYNIKVTPQLFDLTDMFGAGNEPTLEQFEIKFPMSIPYRKETFTIPQSILDLPMYGASAGSVYNYIDFERKVYVQNVGSVDLGTLPWNKGASPEGMYSASLGYVVAPHKTFYQFVNTKYANGNTKDLTKLLNKQGALRFVSTSSNSFALYIIDTEVSDAAALKSSLAGSMMYYELATPIETDISDLIDNGLIFAEGGGTITFKNVKGDDYHIAVPNKETYMVKLADSI